MGKVRAQDEALYTNAAIGITRDGDWLTPKFVGRPFFLKPPLLMWLSALSLQVMGTSLFSVRFPALLLGAAGITAVFLWVSRYRGMAAGVCAGAMLATSTIWQTFSRLAYTDVLAGAFSALAMTAIAFDHEIEKRRTAVLFGVSTGAAILAKSVAGLLPVLALGLYLLARRQRPKFIGTITLTILLVTAPWHIYQLIAHRQYFWAEYIQFQLLGVGIKGMPTGDFRQSPLFYLQRLARMDPVLLLFAVIGVVRFRKEPLHILAACWIAITCAAIFSFQARNLPYLVFLLPAFCVIGGLGLPKLVLAGPVLALTLVVKLFLAGPASSPPIEGAKAMRAIYDLDRNNELILAQPDDEFYSATIPFSHVRYVLVDPTGITSRAVPYYPPLGIVLTKDQFLHLPDFLPSYEAKSREWGLKSTEAIGTTILINTPADLEDLVRSRQDSDFYLPADWPVHVPPSHEVFQFSADRIFLLSKSAAPRAHKQLPKGW